MRRIADVGATRLGHSTSGTARHDERSGTGPALAGCCGGTRPAWRDRYGDELVALMEDDLDGRRPTLRLRASMAAAGLRQRARSAGLAGDGAAPEVRVRAGALVVLASWAALVLGGAAFAKASEHYGDAAPGPRPRPRRSPPTTPWWCSAVVGAACWCWSASVVALPAACALPPGRGLGVGPAPGRRSPPC